MNKQELIEKYCKRTFPYPAMINGNTNCRHNAICVNWIRLNPTWEKDMNFIENVFNVRDKECDNCKLINEAFELGQNSVTEVVTKTFTEKDIEEIKKQERERIFEEIELLFGYDMAYGERIKEKITWKDVQELKKRLENP